MLRIFGHLGVWAGVYVTGALVFIAQVAGLAPVLPPPAIIGAALLMATAAYALDRVKLRDAWLDPADAAAQPDRFAYLTPRAGRVRALAFAMLAAGAALGATKTPWAIAAAVVIPLGVAAYAPLPRSGRARLKDRLWLKNAYVAAGIAAFATLASLAGASPSGEPGTMLATARAHSGALACAIGLLLVRGAIDAALCDIDDEPTDRRFGTATLATTLGPRRLWQLAAFARAGLALATLAASPCPWPARIAWGFATLVGTVGLRLRPPHRVRDWVDVRLALEAALATAILVITRAGS